MKDRSVEFPNRYQMVPVAGTTDTFDFVSVPGAVAEEGTDINKANLLPDAVAEALGLNPADDPQVKDALNAIATYKALPPGAIIQAQHANPDATKFTLCNGASYDVDTWPLLAEADTGNGALWETTGYIPGAAHPLGVVYGNGYYVTVANDSGTWRIYYKTTLSGTWTQGVSVPLTVYSIDFVNGYFVFMSYQYTPQINYTTSPTTAVSSREVYNNNCYMGNSCNVIWTGTYYVVQVRDSNNNLLICYATTLGGTWTTKAMVGACYTPGRLVMANGYLAVIYTSGGNPANAYIAYVAVGSLTGAWTSGVVITGHTFYDFGYCNGEWCIFAMRQSDVVPIIFYRASLGTTGWSQTVLDIAGTTRVVALTYYKSEIWVVTLRTPGDWLTIYHAASAAGPFTKSTANSGVTVYGYVVSNWLIDTALNAQGTLVFVGRVSATSCLIFSLYPAGHIKKLPTISLTKANAFIKHS